MNITYHNLKEEAIWADVREAAGHGGACAAGTSNQERSRTETAQPTGPEHEGISTPEHEGISTPRHEGISNPRAAAYEEPSNNSAASGILQFCRALEKHVCNSAECDHPGRSCEAAGCDNQVCKAHERYCPSCELRYCEDCYEPHLEACYGSLPDAYDAAVEQALSAEGQPTAKGDLTTTGPETTAAERKSRP